MSLLLEEHTVVPPHHLQKHTGILYLPCVLSGVLPRYLIFCVDLHSEWGLKTCIMFNGR